MKKRFFMPGDLWNTGEVERWLEEQAEKGWLPVSFGGCFGCFERSEPRTVRFRLEPNEGETYEKKTERENAYREMGWQFAAILRDYRVYYATDAATSELYTDLSSQAWAWDRQMKKLWRNGVWGMVFTLAWTVWCFRDLWGGQAVQLFLYGIWPLWLVLLLAAGEGMWDAFRQMRGVRRMRRQLAAGIVPDTGAALERGLRRRKLRFWRNVCLIGWVIVYVAALCTSGWEENLSDMVEPLPYVAMADIEPNAAAEKPDWQYCRGNRSLLVPLRYEIKQGGWNSHSALEAGFDRLRVACLAEPLYRERLAAYQKRYPAAKAEAVDDSRFDRAALLTGPSADGGVFQVFLAYRGRAVLYEAVRLNGDLKDHMDDFAAILTDFS